MLNLKLKTIASLITKDDIVLDTCTDHAYLPIYLKKEGLCKEVYASDINEFALENAKKNIKKYHVQIETFLADGFKGINNDTINTAVIAGVGAATALEILKYMPSNIKKVIVSCNNKIEEFRKSISDYGLYIEKEIVVEENNKFYVIDLLTKEFISENNLSLKYGKSMNLDYYEYLLNKEKNILKFIPSFKILEKKKHKINIKELNMIINYLNNKL